MGGSMILKILKSVKEYWGIILVVVGMIAAGAVFPFRLEAMEKRQDQFEQVQQSLYEQTTMIGSWVQQEQQSKQYEKERYEAAPPGWRWDPNRREYVAER